MSSPNEAQSAWEEYMRRSGMPSCAFSTRKTIKIGTGTTTQRKESKIFWVGTKLDDSQFEIQRVNKHMAPSGDVQHIPADKFYKDFHPEVELFNTRILPVMRSIEQAVNRGDRHRERGEPYSAEFEYNIALGHDEQCVRALFGMGLVYLSRNETDKARNVFKELVEINATFAPEHKHLFNEFGIQMRKRGMFEEAVSYFQRGLRFDTDDENLFFNAARANYEMGNYQECVRNLTASLEINSAANEAREFARYLQQHIGRLMREARLENHIATPLREAVEHANLLAEQQTAPDGGPNASESKGNHKRLRYDTQSRNIDILS